MTALLTARPAARPTTAATRRTVENLARSMGWALTRIPDAGDGYVWRLECVDGSCSEWENGRETPAWNEFRDIAEAADELADMLAGV